MDESTWTECKQIFAEVSAAPLSERRAILEHRCRGRVEILQEVHELLEVARRGHPRLDGPPWTTPPRDAD
ncbi:MAG: hypothetical protein AB8G96_05085 [Phycisphaerales bacterium]